MNVAASPIPLTRPSTDSSELEAVSAVLASGWLAGQGPRSFDLETAFKALTGTLHAVAVNNCTAGLHLALLAQGIGPGDEVLVSDYTFPATAHAVRFTGATPVFVDVRIDTGTIDVDAVPTALTDRTRGIVAVDALGMPADWDDLRALAIRHDLFLLEDAACSAGATYRGRPCGGLADVAVFSLHARKGVTSGEGGVITTNNPIAAETMRRWSCFGMRSAFERQASDSLILPVFEELGYNYKLSDVLAAIGTVQVSKLDHMIACRAALADRYASLLSGAAGVTTPREPDDRTSAWQTYALLVDEGVDRDALIAELRRRGIGSNIGTYALHLQPMYAQAVDRELCNSRALFERHLAIPMFADLTFEDQDRVVDALMQSLIQVS